MLRRILLVACFVLSHARECLLHEISSGKWVYQGNNITRKSFTCCEWDYSDWKDPEITSQCGSKDFPSKETYRYGRLDFPVQVGAHSCVCDELQHTRLTVSEREKYTWVPRRCSLLAWNATAFCEQLGHRKIMFIGDSTVGQSAATLMNMIVSDEPKGLCGPQLLVHRLDMPSQSRELVAEQLYTFAPDIIVFNFGAHYHVVEEFRTEVEEFLETFVASYRRNVAPRPVHFVWKTHNPPYPQCEHFTSPVPVPPVQESTFQWDLLDQFDAIARNITAKHHFEIIDMYPLKLRADAHPARMAWDVAKKGGDCLHFCMPGPLDLFSTLMHHMLFQHDHNNDSGWRKRRLLRR